MKVVDECQTNSPDIVSIAISEIENPTVGSVKSALAQPRPDSSDGIREPRQMSLIQLLSTD